MKGVTYRIQFYPDSMTCYDLNDKIRSWVWLYRNSPYPSSTDPIIANYNGSAAGEWMKEMYADVTKFDEPIELMWTEAGEELQAAIDLARSADHTKLRVIHDKLRIVERYIAINNLCPRK